MSADRAGEMERTADDTFLTEWRRPPRPEFAAALYERLNRETSAADSGPAASFAGLIAGAVMLLTGSVVWPAVAAGTGMPRLARAPLVLGVPSSLPTAGTPDVRDLTPAMPHWQPLEHLPTAIRSGPPPAGAVRADDRSAAEVSRTSGPTETPVPMRAPTPSRADPAAPRG